MTTNTPAADKCQMGVPGLDQILGGGLPRNNIYLIQGHPGTGKTTLALQFLLKGAALGERSLYITFSETKTELENVARSHDWDLSSISILELSALSPDLQSFNQNTLFHPSDFELSRTIELLLTKIRELNPSRIVVDSVSELRLLAESGLRYRRQMLSFKEFFIGRGTTVLFLDDLTTEAGDVHVQSIVHGVMLLEKLRAAYGVERRQFHIVKLRGVGFSGGTHDFLIERGGVVIFPRLVASAHNPKSRTGTAASELPALDQLLGGGFDHGTSNLIMGPAGTGKSTLTLQFAVAAARRGERVSLFSFEESLENLCKRGKSLGMDPEPFVKSGAIKLRKIDPAELTPGQFASLLREAAVVDGIDMVVIDSLNGYLHAMPEQQFLMLQLHELLAFLGNRGVVTILVLAQAGLLGNMQTPLDLTYLADTVLVTRYFEAYGSLKKAISVIKKRTGAHEQALRELSMNENGLFVGPILSDFRGIFSGIPSYSGDGSNISGEEL